MAASESALPRIFDNIERDLLEALCVDLKDARAADLCVGYFSLRGWECLAEHVERFSGKDDSCCRVLVGMYQPPSEAARDDRRASQRGNQQYDYGAGDNEAAARHFREQLKSGVPTDQAELALRHLANQLRSRKTRVRSYLKRRLHAKLYLVHRDSRSVAYLGSSNLTLSGLRTQAELNIDVPEAEPIGRLRHWFDDRWNESADISDALARLIESSWASTKEPQPYHVYLKMAHHLSEDARRAQEGVLRPHGFEKLYDFQAEAVSLCVRHLREWGGVLLADVVGLGKTLMASAVAKYLQSLDGTDTLVICPPALEEMWNTQYVEEYSMDARVMSLGKVTSARDGLPQCRRRFRLVVIDESHNLRNPTGQRYRAILDYIQRDRPPNVLLLTATPFNKQYADLTGQLGLIVDDDQDLGVRPERFLAALRRRGMDDARFIEKYGVLPTTLRAFSIAAESEEGGYTEDWRDLMKLFMVRRTRQFVRENYAKRDAATGKYYLVLGREERLIPERKLVTVEFPLNENDPNDQYARLYREDVVTVIENLALPRYGLVEYLSDEAHRSTDEHHMRIVGNLGIARTRLRGFCRTNLFKRLESSGSSFLKSIERHILRNLAVVYALDSDENVPIGTLTAQMTDTEVRDEDVEYMADEELPSRESGTDELEVNTADARFLNGFQQFRRRAEHVYDLYRTKYETSKNHWLPSAFFKSGLREHLEGDAQALHRLLEHAGAWRPRSDAKLKRLEDRITNDHVGAKWLVFTQFADTATYIGKELRNRGVQGVEVVTSMTKKPTALVRRFSPSGNGGLADGEEELRILVATDVLAEGQNLQDSYVVVNYDLPWAIIRLIQRAGRVDRIGQNHDPIYVYSFWPTEGVDRLIRLRERLVNRLRTNQEVIGTDESFFGEKAADCLRELYKGNPSPLEQDEGEEVDLSSEALQVWRQAKEADQAAAEQIPPLAGTALEADTVNEDHSGVIVHMRLPDRSDALVHIGDNGRVLSQSAAALFRLAACAPGTPARDRAAGHNDLVRKAVETVITRTPQHEGPWLRRSLKRRVVDKFRTYFERVRADPGLFNQAFPARGERALRDMLTCEFTTDTEMLLHKLLDSGVTDEELAVRVVALSEQMTLCDANKVLVWDEPVIVSSLGILPVH